MNEGAAEALYRSLGSIDFSAAVRSVLMRGRVDHEPDRGRAVFHIKCNYAKEEAPLGYDVTDAGFTWRSTPTSRWPRSRAARWAATVKSTAARDWLKKLLAAGPRDGAEVKQLALEEGITARTLADVADEGWIAKTQVDGTRKFTWSLNAIGQAMSGPRTSDGGSSTRRHVQSPYARQREMACKTPLSYPGAKGRHMKTSFRRSADICRHRAARSPTCSSVAARLSCDRGAIPDRTPHGQRP